MTAAAKRKSTAPAAKPTIPADAVYVLRTCNADMMAHGRFLWPADGYVAAPDWKPKAECGNGLHGLLWGTGSASYLNRDPDAKWLVVAVEPASVVSIDGDKVKFPRGWVVFCGDRLGAVADIIARGADPATCVYATLTGGDGATEVIAVAEMLRTGASQLAVKIDHEYAGLFDDQREELRWLSMSLLEWADTIDPVRAPTFETALANNVVRLPVRGRAS